MNTVCSNTRHGSKTTYRRQLQNQIKDKWNFKIKAQHMERIAFQNTHWPSVLVYPFFFVVHYTETPITLVKAAVLLSSSRLPYSLSLRSIGFGHMDCLRTSCSWQCCSRRSAVMMSCVAWAHLRLTNVDLAVHVSIKSVAPSAQLEQIDLLWSVQSVEAIWPIKVWVLLLPFFFFFFWWGFW